MVVVPVKACRVEAAVRKTRDLAEAAVPVAAGVVDAVRVEVAKDKTEC